MSSYDPNKSSTSNICRFIEAIADSDMLSPAARLYPHLRSHFASRMAALRCGNVSAALVADWLQRHEQEFPAQFSPRADAEARAKMPLAPVRKNGASEGRIRIKRAK